MLKFTLALELGMKDKKMPSGDLRVMLRVNRSYQKKITNYLEKIMLKV